MIILKRDNVEIIVDTEDRAKIAEAKGFKRLSAKPKAAEPIKPNYEAMTKSELIAIAYELGIDFNSRARKADILRH